MTKASNVFTNAFKAAGRRMISMPKSHASSTKRSTLKGHQAQSGQNHDALLPAPTFARPSMASSRQAGSSPGQRPYLRTASGCAGRLGVLSILPRAKEAIGL